MTRTRWSGKRRETDTYRYAAAIPLRLTSYLCFDNWEALMDFMLKSFDPLPPEPKTG